MKKILLLTLTTTFCFSYAGNPDSLLGDPSDTVRADDIPAGIAGYNYISGAAAANDSIPIPSYSRTVEFGATVYASMHRACGELNPFKNFQARIESQITEKIDQVKEIAMSIPQLIIDSAVEYAMAKINPTLNQLFTKKIDEYIELFRINVKTCEDVQADLAANPNASIFDSLVQFAVADQWKEAIENEEFDNSRRFKEKLLKKAQKNGLRMADGKKYGGQYTPPINFVQSIAEAGINIISGRNNKSRWKYKFDSDDYSQKPITGVFKKPQELVDFVEDIYGSTTFKIAADSNSEAVKTKAGVGYYRRYSETRNRNIDALTKYVNNQIAREAFEEKTGILIPPVIIDDMKIMDVYARQVQIEQLAKQYAIEDMNKKLIFARNALNAGVNAPDMVQSQLSGLSRQEYKKIYFMILDDIAELAQLKYQ